MGVIRPLLAALAASAAVPAAAQVTVDAPMSSGAVVQHGAPIAVAGSAPPGAAVEARLGPVTERGRADADGRFVLALPPLAAGGPYTLEVTSGGARTQIDDIRVGDVWLCSGQSNMELPVTRALNAPSEIANSADPDLRLLTIAQRTADMPQRRFAEPPQWLAAGPDSVADFSAACYFMGRDLRKISGRAIGLIDASWGGSRIRPWIPLADVAALGTEAADLAMLGDYRTAPARALRSAAERWESWWLRGTGRARAEAPWVAPDALDWAPVPAIAPWEHWGVPALAAFDGTVWFRRTVTLTEEQAKSAATLHLGVLDEMDAVWLNGAPLAAGFGWADPRAYRLAPGRLRSGANELLVAVNDSWGDGGFHGPADALRIESGAGDVMIGDGWRWAIQSPDLGVPPRTPWESHAGISGMYNGMIAPLGRIGLAGVAWYQGESDVGVSGYGARLSAMMHGWRGQFGNPDLPFLIVDLAGYGAPARAPVESDTAAIRNAQRATAIRDSNAALVVAADLGNREDIHPADKQEVARRLVRAASALVYGGDAAGSGPEAVRVERVGEDLFVEVRGATGTLAPWSAAAPIGFELCGEAAGSCRFASARVGEGGVQLLGDGHPVARVRYGWADMPLFNLYDDADLPLGPFELPVAP